MIFILMIFLFTTADSKPSKQKNSKTAPAKAETKVNSIDSKLSQYQKVTDKYCNLIEKQNNGENIYQELNNVTVEFAELNQELSAMIENGKFSRKQYDKFIKITEKYESCQ